MKRNWKSAALRLWIAAMVWVTMLAGCRSNKPIKFGHTNSTHLTSSTYEFESVPAAPSFDSIPESRTALASFTSPATIDHSDVYSRPPLTSAEQLPPTAEVSLDEVILEALGNSKILRSLNAQILNNPRSATGVFDPAIQATDPVFGVEAALAQFDAILSASVNHANNDNVFNNNILGGGATEVVQDLTTADFAIQKLAATGTQYTLRNNWIYDSNNNPTSRFSSSYAGFWEAQARHPLLQGNGLEFNRIAGPNARPGFRNTSGVIISRINNEISIAQFERNVRQFVNETINAYWDLYFAYRNFESTRLARDTSLETWNTVKARYDNDLVGGEADKEAQAREQYFQFQQLLVTALNGDPRSNATGVLQAEANLRRLIGLPQNDGHLIFPSDQPASIATVYDWDSLVNIALQQRVELRQQHSQIRRNELELLASRNFLLPRLDAVATFRNNGFGDNLTGGGSRFSSAVSDMSTGDHNEWEMGLQLNVPIGYRQASVGVRNAELQLIRERSILDEQQKLIVHQLGTSIRQNQQYQSALEFAFNRLDAARDTVGSRQAAFDADSVPLDSLLEAQRRLADAETAFHRAQVNLQLATENVLRDSGQLLSSHAIELGQQPSSHYATATCRSTIQNQTLDYRSN